MVSAINRYMYKPPPYTDTSIQVIDSSEKEMVYYDSMGGKGTVYTSELQRNALIGLLAMMCYNRNYLEKESLKRRHTTTDKWA